MISSGKQAQLDIPHSQQATLNNPDLNSAAGLNNAIGAAKALQRAMNAELKPGMVVLSIERMASPVTSDYFCRS